MGWYFTQWLEEAQRLEKERLAQPAQGEVQTHPGFGRNDVEDEDAWGQFFEHILWVNEGSPDHEVREGDEDDMTPAEVDDGG